MAKRWPEKKQFDDSENIYLKEDQQIEVRLLEEAPEIYYIHWMQAENKSVACKVGDCPHCNNGIKRSEKGSIPVFDCIGKTQKKLSGTSALFISIREAMNMVAATYETHTLMIKATGKKAERRYNVIPKPFADGDVMGKKAEAPTEDEAPF